MMEPVAWTPADLEVGKSYEAPNWGYAKYKGTDCFYGDLTYAFEVHRQGYGMETQYVKEARLNDFLAPKAGDRVKELERERDEWKGRSERMANDWLQFCADMDVTWDAQEAVAYELKADFSNLRARAEAAEALLKEAREALQPFADVAATEDDVGREDTEDDRILVVQAHGCQLAELTVDHFRAARAISDKIGVKDE